MAETQADLDRRNIAFWDELCGTALAERLEITDASAASLARFDRHYLGELYPYLERYLPERRPDRDRILEIGLGYGTVSQILAERGFEYHGLDIAAGPVEMVRHRLQLLGIEGAEERVRTGSVLDAPYPDESFDHVVAIGCLHHTGDLPGAVAEVHRLLRPGGRALAMVYNRRSFRLLKLAYDRRRGKGEVDEEEVRRIYDANAEGDAAPRTEYVSAREARRLFGAFSRVRVRRENFDDYMYRGRIDRYRGKLVPRRLLLGPPAKLAGLDLYITATK